MKFELTHKEIAEITDRANLDPDSVRTGYSGRGMYGATCFAIDVDGRGTIEVIRLIDAVIETTGMDREDAIDIFGEPSSDAMGLGTVLYWRNVTVSE